MQLWAHKGMLCEVNSSYSLPDDAWQYELAGRVAEPTSVLRLKIVEDVGPWRPGP